MLVLSAEPLKNVFIYCHHRLQMDQSSPGERIRHNNVFVWFPSSSSVRGRWGRNGRHQGKVKKIGSEKAREREWERPTRFETALWVGVQEM